MFDRGELRLVLLKLIADQPRHGYDLIKAVEELTGGEYVPSPGVIYPSLQMMVDESVIAELPDESSRKVFTATDQGREELAREEETVGDLMERLSSLGEERRSSPHRQMHRAMENLRNSVRLHRQAGAFDVGEIVEQIVDIIDEAARKIERL
jgi:DNA-binding PadR family transcriptional regulator